jgi:hypothetical protein
LGHSQKSLIGGIFQYTGTNHSNMTATPGKRLGSPLKFSGTGIVEMMSPKISPTKGRFEIHRMQEICSPEHF